ncbi:unnamed protein product (macronuclear) [Paramecium tetraurelia]|uniref:Cystatin domain-containing protein n=1 Tax=Paramecium tetraurelia TaxID=5888 RepID=A0DB23_PARTE|nr:uncharacterized protein GSPATT00015134001 [Paramecium tetraurelia]CAK80240.1 unnamed protein product [Paramecium tetraurelia]|eukprot:XP_001447637.1 hypothetical protein (macronuclear) [Paramecium tetraurelia strain d4-2]
MLKLVIFTLFLITISARLDQQDPAVGKKNTSSNKQESDVMKYRRAAAMAKEEFQGIELCLTCLELCGLNGFVWKQTTQVDTQVVSGFNYSIYGKVQKGDQTRTVKVSFYIPAGQDSRIKATGCSIVA